MSIRARIVNARFHLAPASRETRIRTVYESRAVGIYFEVDPADVVAIGELIGQVRAKLAAAKAAGAFCAYLSVPVSPRGGGHLGTNQAIAKAITSSVECRFGGKLFVINPAAFTLPTVGGTPPGGGEYMAVWGDVLAGDDHNGDVFDLVYFTGPNDVASYFSIHGDNKIEALNVWIDAKAAQDPDFKSYITTGDNRKQFLRYYAIRGSSVYSKGSHDEWNIVAGLNLRRPIGDDIAVYFDGHAVEPSDYDTLTDRGYQSF